MAAGSVFGRAARMQDFKVAGTAAVKPGLRAEIDPFRKSREARTSKVDNFSECRDEVPFGLSI